MAEKAEELKTCLQLASAAREDERMYQRAADNAPDDAVRKFNQHRADRAKDKADTYEQWAEANR